MPSYSPTQGAGPSSTRPSRDLGFTVMELLVVIAIVSVLAAIGLPSLFRTSATAVLDGNARNLATLVGEEMLEGYNKTYRQTGEGSPNGCLSSRLEYLLGQAVGAARYSNPRVDGTKAFVILNSSSIPVDTSSASPAVFITDNPECCYEGFEAQQYDAYRQRLAGSLVVQFNTTTQSVDVFYVDPSGSKSDDVVRFPTG
jgi:prepilin-type N-terminal cleavage/methylation domain-containing protein